MMIKFRIYIDRDKEQEWLNIMSKKGYAFHRYFMFLYFFSKCKPGAYAYQIDLIEAQRWKEEVFLDILKETQVEAVSRWGNWVYLRRDSGLGDFQLYSDNSSRASQYSRMGRFYLGWTVLEFLFCYSSVVRGALEYKDWISYLTLILMVLTILLLGKMAIKCFIKARALNRGY